MGISLLTAVGSGFHTWRFVHTLSRAGFQALRESDSLLGSRREIF